MYDTLFNFGPHTDVKKDQLSGRVPVMKAVRGFDMETLIDTYKTLILPVFSHSPAVWVPNTKPTNIERLKKVQNCCLRISTGCHQATSIDHLHREEGILPVGAHLDMLSAQYLASVLRPTHPNHELVLLPPDPRRSKNGRPLKETLSSKFMHVVEPYLNEADVMAEMSYKGAISFIHTSAVSDTIGKLVPVSFLDVLLHLFRPLKRGYFIVLGQPSGNLDPLTARH